MIVQFKNAINFHSAFNFKICSSNALGMCSIEGALSRTRMTYANVYAMYVCDGYTVFIIVLCIVLLLVTGTEKA